jgi:outer membrane protein TolC
LFVTLLPAAGLAAQAELTLAQALALAEQRSLQLPAEDAAAQAARELSVAAGQQRDPSLTVGVNNLPVNGPDAFSLTSDFMTMASVGVMQQFTPQHKRDARSARFARQADVARASRAMALAVLRRDTALAWIERHYAERQGALWRDQLREAGLQADAAEAAYRGGGGAQADVFVARSAQARIQLQLQQAELQRDTASTRLARWVGEDAAARPLAPAPAWQLDRLHDGNLDDGAMSHPQITVLQQREAVARAELAVAHSEKDSDWSVELMYSQRGPNYSNMVSLNLSIPLQLDRAQRQDRDVSARAALAEQLRAQREDAAQAVRAELRSWLQLWHNLGTRLDLVDTSLVPLAAERQAAALAAYRGGSAPLDAVLQARRAAIDVAIDQLRLEQQRAELWARLEMLLPPTDGGQP